MGWDKTTLTEQEGLWDEAFCSRWGPSWCHPTRAPQAEGRFGEQCKPPLFTGTPIPPLTCRNSCKLLFKRAKLNPLQQQPDKQAPNTLCILTLLQPLPFPFPSVFADEETFHGCWPNLPSLLQNVPTKGRILTRQRH